MIAASGVWKVDCEIVVSDNASTDGTREVSRRWQEMFRARGIGLRINRNDQNIGPLPNIARCIELSTSRFTWVVGDDDDIPDSKVAWLVALLRAEPDLASVVMNFAGTGWTEYTHCYKYPCDQLGEGVDVLNECLRQAYFGLAFMTAHVYRTEFARAALRAWPEGTSNYDFQIFLTAYVGTRGRVLATRDTHVTYVTGDNVYNKDARVAQRLYADTLEVFLQLRRIGYDPRLCRRLALGHIWSLKKRFVRTAVRVDPRLTLRTTGRLVAYLMRLRGDPPSATVAREQLPA